MCVRRAGPRGSGRGRAHAPMLPERLGGPGARRRAHRRPPQRAQDERELSARNHPAGLDPHTPRSQSPPPAAATGWFSPTWQPAPASSRRAPRRGTKPLGDAEGGTRTRLRSFNCTNAELQSSSTDWAKDGRFQNVKANSWRLRAGPHYWKDDCLARYQNEAEWLGSLMPESTAATAGFRQRSEFAHFLAAPAVINRHWVCKPLPCRKG
ncbi:hypothetical protein VULLAG_LOCUS10314 [Vulpes lagopus]